MTKVLNQEKAREEAGISHAQKCRIANLFVFTLLFNDFPSYYTEIDRVGRIDQN